MAASGINEHHEARRKQRFLDMQAYKKKEMAEYHMANPNPLNEMRDQPQDPDDIVRKVGSPPGITFKDIEKYNKDINCKNPLVVYSAKIPNRLSSINYSQQW